MRFAWIKVWAIATFSKQISKTITNDSIGGDL